VRIHSSEHNTYFVTNRCFQERFFFLPKPGVIALIGSWLAKALKEYGDGIELYGFIFMSSHLHLLLCDTKGQLAQFMWYFQLNVGKALNREFGRRGYFFAREYDAAPVLTDEDFENRYAYILTNPVKAGLTASAKAAPFFSSLEAALTDKTLQFVWLDRTKKHNKSRRGQKVKNKSFEELNELPLAIPPMWEKLTAGQRRARIGELVKVNEIRYGRQRRAEGLTVLGVPRILAQSPFNRSKNPARSPRVKVFCHIEALAKEYLESVRTTVGLYRQVYEGLMKAARKRRPAQIEWPPGCYPPSSMIPMAQVL